MIDLIWAVDDVVAASRGIVRQEADAGPVN
jgi:hypothetical protein